MKICKFFYFVFALLLLSGCDGCDKQELIDAIIKIGSQPPTKIVRIAGVSYMDFSAQSSSQDIWKVYDGVLHVYHVPSCDDNRGDEGDDTFFDIRPLPDGCELIKVEFTVCGNTNDCSGDIFNNGRLSAEAYRYSNNKKVKVEWYNTCYKVCKGFPCSYNISFLVSVPFGTDLGEPTFTPSLDPKKPDLDLYDCDPDNPNSGGSYVPPGGYTTGPTPDNPNVNPPSTPCQSDMREICANTAIPTGYVIQKVELVPTMMCGTCQTLVIFKPCPDTKAGSILTVTIGSPVPSGWEEYNSPNSRYCNENLQTCLPCDATHPNVKIIVKK